MDSLATRGSFYFNLPWRGMTSAVLAAVALYLRFLSLGKLPGPAG